MVWPSDSGLEDVTMEEDQMNEAYEEYLSELTLRGAVPNGYIESVRESGARAVTKFSISRIVSTGFVHLEVSGMTEKGIVYGAALLSANETRGFEWTKAAGMRFFNSPVNQVLHQNSSGDSTVYLATGKLAKMLRNGAIEDLALPAGYSHIVQALITDDGEIVGKVFDVGTSRTAYCVWPVSVHPQTFAYPADIDGLSSIRGITATKIAVDWLRSVSLDDWVPVQVDFRAKRADRIDITGVSPGRTQSGVASGISNGGRIVGYSPGFWQEGQAMQAFHLRAPGAPVEKLSTRKAFAFPNGIDDMGNVAGIYYANGAIDDPRAFFLRKGRLANTFYDLTSEVANQGWSALLSANYVNSSGQICGYGRYGADVSCYVIDFS